MGAARNHSQRFVRQRGIAMLLVLIALSVGFVLAGAFAAASSTSIGISQNLKRHGQARGIAESGLELGLATLHLRGDWRTAVPNGVWVRDQPFGGGTFTLQGQDGDLDGGDGDLADDPNDKVLLIATGTFEGVTHTVRAVVTPAPIDVLMVVGDPQQLTALEQDRLAMIRRWGWTAALLADEASAEAYTQAAAGAAVAYLPDDVHKPSVRDKLRRVSAGVVSEKALLSHDMGFSASRSDHIGSEIVLTDSSHYITQRFAAGMLAVATEPDELSHLHGRLAEGGAVLAQSPMRERAMLMAIETGGQLQGRGEASGRRVYLPFGRLASGKLNEAGQTLLQRAFIWAAGKEDEGERAEAAVAFHVQWVEGE